MTTERNRIKLVTLLCLVTPSVLSWGWVLLIYRFGRDSWQFQTLGTWSLALPPLALVGGTLLLISSVILRSQRSNSFALITGAFLTVIPLVPAVLGYFSLVFYPFFLIGTLLYMFAAGFNINGIQLHNFLKNRLTRNCVLSLSICASAALWALSPSGTTHLDLAPASYFLLYVVLVHVIVERPDYWSPAQ